jgi:uncharacterized protein (TIGR03067 family)
MIRLLLFALGVSALVMSSRTPCALAQDGTGRTAEGDQKALQGSWVGVVEEFGGKQMNKGQIKDRNRRLTVKGNKFTMKRVQNDKVGTYEGRFELDPKASPAAFDLSGKNPAGRAVEFLGIYELNGDEFRLCYVEAGQEAKRPDAFETAPGNGRVYLLFKRDKE